jgi:cellulose synthase/poly-beta-1,6-N-acetylglucosamine synthase-like glycosyltransferase
VQAPLEAGQHPVTWIIWGYPMGNLQGALNPCGVLVFCVHGSVGGCLRLMGGQTLAVQIGGALLSAGAGLFLYSYLLYPALLGMWRWRRVRPQTPTDPEVWPTVSISLPSYNEEHQIAETLESLMALDYPKDKIQILVVSDASDDRTEEIVQAYSDRGVELLRLTERHGKGAAEIAATPHLTGEIVLNTDASIRIVPDALKPLIRQFSDREVGLASGRDVSVSSGSEDTNRGESGYVGYEMAIRDMETRVDSIVGASGCFYAIRDHLHRVPLPISLSRDFAAALHCRERGYRAVSVPEAVCFVPRVSSINHEYRRKVRTITRGLQTLIHKRRLMNPFRYGVFSWMLFSHKVCRWLVPWAGTGALIGLGLLSPGFLWARILLLATLGGLAVGGIGWMLSDRRDLPAFLSLPAFGLMGNVAAMHAFLRVLHGDQDALWTPTRRGPAPQK